MRFSSTFSLATLATSTAAQSFNSAKSDLDGSVWQSVTDALGFKNYGWDQVIAGKGQLNVCVRWESTASVTAEQRTKVATALQDSYTSWMKWVSGWDNFPYEDVKINVVGWAVKDKSLLQGSTTGLDIYTDTDAEGIPQCSEKCGRFFHQDGDYSQCPGGAERHYDNSLWLTDGMQGGAGGDWGQRIGREYFMDLLGTKKIHILQHEIGHTFALDDFYDWTPTGQSKFIMLAGSATEVTDFDGWMLRNYSDTKTVGSTKDKVTSAPVATKSASAKPVTSTQLTTTAKKPAVETAAAEVAKPKPESGVTADAYAQCGGGASYTGPTKCASGLKCTKHNEWYSQCL
ncbi:hypothetical protein NXS19_004605 [Fusarium pseudograminearum]|nr:hypothetical protein NXS19_004605 [Fusarium pseudograminearum]